MNKIYKIVWNAGQNAWVVVSELGKSKTKSKTVKLNLLAPILLGGLVTISFQAKALPGIYVNDGVDTGCAHFADTYNSSGSTTGTALCVTPVINRNTVTNKAMFYGGDGVNGSDSLILSGQLYVNSGNLGLGGSSTDNTGGDNSIRIGGGRAAVSGLSSNATGVGTLGVTNSGANSIAIGTGVTDATATAATGANSLALGYSTTASNTSTIALGNGATAAATRSVAIGDSSTTGVSGNGQSVAIGSVAAARGDQSVALGNNVNSNGDSSIAIGSDDISKVRTAFGSSYQTITGTSLPSGFVETTATGGGAVVVGATARAVGNFSTALGMAASSIGDASVALGTTSNASGQGALAIGAVSNASNTNSIAMGVNAVSSGINSTAIGSGSSSTTGARATADNAVAIGSQTQAALNATAIGTGATAASSGTAIGIGSTASQAGGVAIGSNSVASTAGSVAGYDPITGTGSTTTTGVWRSTNAAVAVGNGSTVTRQITGLAAGTADTDAVNVAQLKLTKTYTDNVARSTATALGGGAALNTATGNISAPTYTTTKTDGTTTTASNVGTALTNLNTEVVKPITFAGNTGSSTRKLGETLTISGGSTAASSNSNVKTVVNGNTLDIQIANAPTFTGAVTANGFNANNNKITNVTAGTADTDAVNVSQLNSTTTAANNAQTAANTAQTTANTAVTNAATAQATADKGFNITANGANSDNVKLGETLDFANTDNNLVVSTSNNKVTTNLARNLSVDSVTTGNSVLNNTGLSITNGPSVTTSGINAANQKITNVTAGTADTDAVNVSQLNSTTTAANNAQTTANTAVTNAATAQATADKGFNITANGANSDNVKLGETLDFANTDSNLVVSTSNNKVTTNLARNLSVDSVKTGNTTTNTNGVTVTDPLTNTTSVLSSGVTTKNASGDQTTVSAAGLNFRNSAGTLEGPSVSRTGIDAGSKQITNLASAGDITQSSNAANAVNAKDLNDQVTALTTKGLNFADNNGTVTNKKLGETLTIKGTGSKADTEYSADNVKTTTDANGNLVVGLDKNSSFDSITTGNSVLNSNGLTIANGPSITATGVNAANTKITNVADGEVSATSKDAVNGSQLNEVANAGSAKTDQAGNSTASNLGGGSTYDSSTGNISNPTYTTTKTDGTTTTANNVGDALTNINNEVVKPISFGGDSGTNVARKLGETLTVKGGITDSTTLSDNNIGVVANGTDGLEVKLAKNISVDSVKAGDSTLNNNGLTITNGPSITKDGIDAAGTTVSNLKDGTNASDAATKGQLDQVSNSLTTSGLNFADNNGTVTNKKLGETLTIKGTGTKADTEYSADNVKTTTDANGNLVVGLDKNSSFDSITTGNSVLNSNGLTIANGPSITATGVNAANTKITNVADGEVSATSKDAVNGSQLNEVANAGSAKTDQAGNSTASNLGGGSTYDSSTGNISNPTYTTTKTDGTTTTANNVGDALTNINNELVKPIGFADNNGTVTNKKLGETLTIKGTGTKADTEYSADNVKTTTDANGNLVVGLDKNSSFDSITTGNSVLNSNGLTIANGPSITTTGIDAANTKVTNVAAGTADTDAVNVSQIKALNDANTAKADQAGNTIAEILGGGASYDSTTSTLNAPTYTTTKTDGTTTSVNNVGDALTNLNNEVVKPISFGGDSGTDVARKLGETLTVKGGVTDPTALSDNNIGVVANGTDGLDVKLANNINLNSVTTGNSVLNTNGLTIANGPSITTTGIDAANTKITNVADGTISSTSKDAVNGSQLRALESKVGNNISSIHDANGNEVIIADEVVNPDYDSTNVASKFLAYNKSGQTATDSLTIGQTVQRINTQGTKYFHTNNSDPALVDGKTNDSSAGATNSTAVGVNAIIAEGADNTIALGNGTSAASTATNSVVLGNGSSVSGASSIAIGDGSTASGNQAISVGTGNTVSGNNSGAFGDPSTVSGNRSYSIGNNNTVSTDDTFALGNGITQTTAGSVVLGAGSAARTAGGVAGYVPTGATADQAAITATQSTTGAVAVGDATNGVYRQVTGVAAGTENSDAVNVAQLKTVDNKVNTGSASVANILGGNAAVNADGSISNPTYNVGGTNQTTVEGAVNALDSAIKNTGATAGEAAVKAKTSVTNGDNIVVTSSTNADGSTNYEVATTKDLNVDSVTAGNTVLNNDGVKTTDAAGNTSSLTGSGTSISSQDGLTTANYGLNGSTLKDPNGNTNTSTAASNTLADQAGNSNVITAAGSTVTAKDANGNTTAETNYGADGFKIANGPSVTSEGINANNTTISNLKDGTNASDAATKGQLDQVSNSLTTSGLNFADNNGTVTNKKLGETLTIKGTGTKADAEYSADNIKTTTDTNGNLVVGLDKNSSFDSVTAGNTVLNNDGVKTTDAAGNTSSLTGSGTSISSQDGSTTANYGLNGSTLKDPNGNTNTSTAASNTLADQANSNVVTAAGSTVTAKDANGNTTAETNYGADGFKIANGPSVTSEGINANNTTISNLKDGTNASDAATKGQLDQVSNSLTTSGLNFADNNGTVTNKKLGETLTIKGTGTKADAEYSADNVKTTTDTNGNLVVGLDKNSSFDSVTAGNTVLNNDGVKTTDAAGNTSSFTGSGTSISSQDGLTTANYGLNGSTLKDPNGNTNTSTAASNTLADQAGNSNVITAAGNTVTAKDANGNTTAETNYGADGFKIANGPSVTSEGINANNTTISNLKDGTNASDAATKGQLDAISSGLTTSGLNFADNNGTVTNKKLGETLTIQGTGTKADAEYSADNVKTTTDTNGNLVVGLDKNSSFDSVTAGNTVLNNDGVKTTDAAGNTSSLTGSGTSISSQDGLTTANYGLNGSTLKDPNGNTNVITAAGNTVTAKDANGNTTAETNYGADGFKIANGPSVTSEGINANNTTISNLKDGTNASDAATKGQLDTQINDLSSSLTTSGLNFADNNGTVTNKKLGETLTIKGTGTKADAEYSADNIKTTTDTNGNLVVGLDKNSSFDSVTAGNTVLNTSGLTINNGPSITTAGINAAGTKVSNIANGTDANDAINKSQLDALAANVNSSVTEVIDGNGNKVNITNEVVNQSPNNSNTASQFLTYNTSGQETTDRLTIGQTVQKMNTEGVKYSHTNGSSVLVDGKTNDSSAGATNSTAIGVNAMIAEGADNTIALGNGTSATSTATNAVVLGNNSSVSGASSIAIGDGSTASGNQSISVGTGNTVSGNNSGAFGDPTVITGNNSYSVGNNNTVSTDDTFTIGNGISQTTAGSVVLGTGSAARTAGGVAGYVPTGATADQAAITATQSTTGAVAVGDATNGVYRQVTGVAAGTENSDAVNVAQLKTVDNKLNTSTASIANVLGGNSAVNADGSISNPTYNVGGTTSNTLAGALGALDTAIQNAGTTAGDAAIKAKTTVTNGDNVTVTSSTNADGSTNYQVATAKDLKLDSLTTGNTVVNSNGVQVGSNVSLGNSGLTIVNGPSVTTSGIDAGNKVITNVAAGSNATDAVNKGQLDTAISGINTTIGEMANTSTQYDTNADGSVNKDSMTLGGSNGTLISNVAGGKVTSGSKDAVNGGQLADVSNSIAGAIGGNTVVNADGTITTSNVGGTGKSTIDEAIASVNTAAAQAKSTVTQGDNVVVTSTQNSDGSTNYQVATAKDLNVNSVTSNQVKVGNVSIDSNGINAGSQKVTGVAGGGITSGSTDAVNGGQVYTANTNIATYLGGGAAVGSDGQVTQPTYSVAGGSYNNVGDAITAVDSRVGNVEKAIDQGFAYTNNRINRLEDRLSAGIAATAALEQAPFVAGKWTYAAGASYYNNQSAIGATLRRTADSGRWSMTGGIAGGNEGSPLFRVGISGVID
ncbi:Head domain of trimeric autotransporter adhesin [Acinetobacter apis]|uniref:Head domain of trimeric autotransporter adhesin n=1 Tax=Acinetobacter apis TaxID=1229165 RepID=A0A217EHY8_9GAMM|nr:ESPR-type extended signal peptide-containing protein [Acinetobacter apis]SNQ30119.1 Head domain of trimeric autotransporter adhesin [Acinetobacter apis]